MNKIVAVIDLGSNSARMALFRRTSRFGFHLMLESKSRVRISEGCYENHGVLQNTPMYRALEAIKDFVCIAKQYKVSKIFCIATSAVRDAPNRSIFIGLVKQRTGINIKVIDGKKEAFYGAIACANLLHYKSGVTIDIGGGSTECAILKNGVVKEVISIDIGTVRIKELFFDTKEGIIKARKFIAQELTKLPYSFIEYAQEVGVIFGIGGTIRSLAKLLMKKEKYPMDSLNGYEFNIDKNLIFFKELCDSNITQIRKLGMSSDREDTIRGGTLIFYMLLDMLRAKLVVTSGVGVREGIFLSDLLRNQQYKFPSTCNPSLRNLMDKFLISSKKSNALVSNATKIFNLLYNVLNINRSYLKHLQIASNLRGMGNYLSSYSTRQHSTYFIFNALNYGYSHIDKIIICTLIKYSNKKISKHDDLVRLLPSLCEVQALCFVFSIANLVSVTHEVFSYSFNDNTLYIEGVNSFLIRERLSSLNKTFSISVKII